MPKSNHRLPARRGPCPGRVQLMPDGLGNFPESSNFRAWLGDIAVIPSIHQHRN